MHCTDSAWGSVAVIDQWHRERGFDEIGYHYLILNAYTTYEAFKSCRPSMETDGEVAEGRPVWKAGAHVRGHNYNSIGVALVGERVFSKAQIYSAIKLVRLLMRQYKVQIDNVYGHYEFDASKSCPNIDMEYFRSLLKDVV